MTRPADHEGLALPRRHDLYPVGLFPLAFHVQVAKGADMVGCVDMAIVIPLRGTSLLWRVDHPQ